MASLKTVVYEKKDKISSYFTQENSWGFDCVCVKRDYSDLFAFYSQNKVDVMVVCDEGMDRERLEYVLEIVYDNYCKHILIITDTPYGNDSYLYLQGDTANFDLKLSLMLLKIKRKIVTNAQNQIGLLKSKVSEILASLMFSSKHDGYNYYKEAIVRAYMAFPYSCSTMKLYEEIGNMYGKSSHAVEKSMRGALSSAMGRLKEMPITPENYRLRSQLGVNCTNNMTIAMVVSWLRADKDIEIDEEIKII